MCIALYLFALAAWRSFKTVLAATVGFVMAAADAVLGIFRHVVCSQVPLMILAILSILTLVFLIGVYNPEFVMRSCDVGYECGLHPVADVVVTYGLRPARDYGVGPVFRFVNDMSEHVKDEFGDMVDKVQEYKNRPGCNVSDFELAFNEVWDFYYYEFLATPCHVDPPLFGPDFLELPFTRTLLCQMSYAASDGVPLLGRLGATALKNITLSAIRGDIFTKSCFLCTLRSTNRHDYALRNCTIFDDPDYTGDHVNAVDCHNLTDALVYGLLPGSISTMMYAYTNMTAELESFIATLESADICAALLTGTPRVEPEGCYVDNYNCTALPWWVNPQTFHSVHCTGSDIKNTNATIRAPEMDPACALWDLCNDRPDEAHCALADNTMVFSNMNCTDLIAATGGQIGDLRCRNLDKANGTECHKKTWAHWVHQGLSQVLNVLREAQGAVGGCGECAMDYMKTWFAFLVLLVDGNCAATWLEKVQFFLYYNLWSWTECFKPFTAFIFQWKFTPIQNGIWMFWDLSGEVGNSVIDGTVLTESNFFCNEKMPVYSGCDDATAAIEAGNCSYANPGDAYVGSPEGLLLRGVACYDVGFGGDCGTLCSPTGDNSTGCPWFSDKSCMDSAIPGSKMIFVPNYFCEDFKDTCALRYNFDGTDECGVFRGCRMTSFGDNCPDDPAMLHNFTHRFWWIINSTLSNMTYNLLEMEVGDWHSRLEYDQIVQATVVYELLTNIGSCITDGLKGLIGAVFLATDPNCDGSTNDAITYLIRYVGQHTINCCLYIGDAMDEIGWHVPADIWNDLVGIISEFVPHIWTLAMFKADSYYCDFTIHLSIVSTENGGTPLYTWGGDVLDGWGYEGCTLMSGGACEAYWTQCDGNIGEFGCESCEDCTDPFGGIFDWVDTTIVTAVDAFMNATTLATIGPVQAIVDALLEVKHGIIIAVRDLSVNCIRDIIGWFILVSDSHCRAPAYAKAMFCLHNLIRFHVTILNYIITVVNAVGIIVGSVFDALQTLVMFILEETGFFSWVFDAVEDIRVTAYCFGNEHNASDPEQAAMFYYPPFVTGGYPEAYQAYYAFGNCTSTWPDQYMYTADPTIAACDLPGCFERTWECLQYVNMTSLGHGGDLRTGTAIINIVQSNVMLWSVQKITGMVNWVVCGINCMKECGNCYEFKIGQIFKFIRCIFRCLVPGAEWCTAPESPPSLPPIEGELMLALSAYGCFDSCACEEVGRDYACYMVCYVKHGEMPWGIDNCALSVDDANWMCHNLILDTTDVGSPSRANTFPDPYGNPSAVTPDEAAKACHDFSVILARESLMVDAVPGGVSGMHDLVDRYAEAESFCSLACAVDPTISWPANMNKLAACRIFRTMLFDVNTSAATLRAYRESKGPLVILGATDLNKAYCQWSIQPQGIGYTGLFSVNTEAADVTQFLESYECGVLDCRSYHFLKRLLLFMFNYAIAGESVARNYRPCIIDPGVSLKAGTHAWYDLLETDPDRCSGVYSGTPLPMDPANNPSVLYPGYDPGTDPFHHIMYRGEREGESAALPNSTNVEDAFAPRHVSGGALRIFPAQPFGLPRLNRSCYCYSALYTYEAMKGLPYDYTDFRQRLVHEYCAVVRDMYLRNKNDQTVISAFCRPDFEDVDIVNGLKFVTDLTASVLSSPDALEGLQGYVITEIAHGMKLGYINTNFVEDAKSSIGSAFTGMYDMYSGSVVQRIVDDGYAVYHNPTRVGKDQSDWGRRSIDTLYEWSLEAEAANAALPRSVRRGQTSKHRIQNILRSMGGRRRAERLSADSEFGPEPTQEVPAAPAPPWAVADPRESRQINEHAAKRSLLGEDSFLSRWVPGAPHVWGVNSRREEKEYLFFKGSEKFIGSAHSYMRKMATVMQNNYHATGDRAKAALRARHGSGNLGVDPDMSLWDLIMDAVVDLFRTTFDKIKEWFDRDGEGNAEERWDDIWHSIREVLTCHSPEQYDGTRVYNLFCIALPEGIYSWIPSKGEQITRLQINWADELVEVPCVKEDYPDGERPYWRLQLNNCRNQTEPFDEEMHPACPFCDYCRREYDPEAIRFDIPDAMIMTLHWAGALVDRVLDPQFGGGYDATLVDSVHFVTNVGLLFLLVSLAAMYFLGPQMGFMLGSAVAGIYAVWCGFAIQTAVAFVVYFVYGAPLTVIWIGVSVVLLFVGGIPFEFAPVAWVAEVLRWIVNALETVLIPAGWLEFITERFERFTFGGDPVPRLYVQLYFIYLSETTIGLLMVYLITAAVIYPLIKVFEVLMSSIFRTIAAIAFIWHSFRLHKMSGKISDLDDRLDMAEEDSDIHKYKLRSLEASTREIWTRLESLRPAGPPPVPVYFSGSLPTPASKDAMPTPFSVSSR